MAYTARRTPTSDERLRDPERTRRLLLDAARTEFATKGLQGARVSAIAERAGVNKQLISYYFGGKQGLYDAIIEEWLAREKEIQSFDIDLADLACRYLDVVFEQPELNTLFIRQNLDADVDAVAFEPDSDDLREMARRADLGEIPDDVDPAFLLLVLQSIVSVGVMLPADVKRHLGLDPSSDEFHQLAASQLRILVRRMLGSSE